VNVSGKLDVLLLGSGTSFGQRFMQVSIGSATSHMNIHNKENKAKSRLKEGKGDS
jgi:hypothetical protein